jgi:hypothetical protein
MVAGFKSERRPASNRYARPDYVGIRTYHKLQSPSAPAYSGATIRFPYPRPGPLHPRIPVQFQ